MTTIPEKVLIALQHVQSIHPEVVQVFYGVDQRWLYTDADFNGPNFDSRIDVSLLEDAAGSLTSFPAAFCCPEYEG